MQFKTQYNYDYTTRSYEDSQKASLTEQGQAHTIDEIFKKFRAGIRLEIQKPVYYDNLEDFEALDVTRDGSFDLADYTELKTRLEVARDLSDKRKELEREANEREPTSGKLLVEPVSDDSGTES